MVEKGQPRPPGEAQSAESFCAAWKKVFSGEPVWFFGLEQALGERSQEREGVWGAGEQELGDMEEGQLQRKGEAGR